MFQNLSKDTEDKIGDRIEPKDNVRNNLNSNIIKETFSIRNCIIYILSFMISMAGGESTLLGVTPFGFAMIAASVGSEIPVIMVAIACIIGTICKNGSTNILSYILTILLFIVSILLFRPRENQNEYEINENKKVGVHMAISVMLIQVLTMFFKTFYMYDFLYSIMLALSTYILYKIFVNSLIVFKEFGYKKVFAIEEVIGASLMAVIAFSSLGNLNIFGYSIRNILSILAILVLGWQNGMLVGATGGLTIGLTIGIIQGQGPNFIAAYAISGLIAGILNKLGKIGVIVGFILGNIILSYISNGNTISIIGFQEILIAALGLLAMPKSATIKVSDLMDKYKLLPETTGRTLEENKATINQLNNMSNTISEIAKEYQSAAATVEDSELEEQEKNNKELFISELEDNLENIQENLLYTYINDNEDNILDDIFNILITNEVITRKDIIDLFAKNNNYIVNCSKDDCNYSAKEDIDEMARIINNSYRVSKINFIWKKKIDENRKSVSSQLTGVSEAISNLANNIEVEDNFLKEKQEIKALLKDKEINVKDLTIKSEQSDRFIVTIYTNVCESIDGKQCVCKKIDNVLNKVLKNKMILQKQKCGLRVEDDTCMFVFTSEDNFGVQIGIAKTKKYGSVISGDTTTQTVLQDGKNLIALSDGMGSGPEARKSSKIAIKMLERLIENGFNNDTALKLINSIISNNTEDDMYATLDVNILDLFNGSMKFFKNGACPTFIKRNKNVEILKSVSLPTGILQNIDLVEYNYDLQDGDIVVMCSDGVLDSNSEYANKELWIKYLLEEIETDDAQRIADIIISEARDNNFGKEKDDMTAICFRIHKK